MKKIFFLFAIPFMFFSLHAQVTQEQAGEIVIEYLNDVTGDFTLYTKEELQTVFEITTVTGEILELDYRCWVYYASITDEMNGKYLIVKESNGNILEINTRNDDRPEDLEDWIFVIPIDILFEEYSLEGTSCRWTNLSYPYPGDLIIINSAEELNNYISCTEGSYPEIDFLQYTLLLAYGMEAYLTYPNYTDLQQFSAQNYVMTVNLLPGVEGVVVYWEVPIVVSKITDGSVIELVITKNY
jgi:hypothetical protein